jgi:hypothetical protein
MWHSRKICRLGLLLLFAWLLYGRASAQHFLDSTITLSVGEKSVRQVLYTIQQQGGFLFSYNSNLVPEDSLVSLSLERVTVRHLLEQLLGPAYSYTQSGNYLIIHRENLSGKIFVVRGYITDKHTGEKMTQASVYERKQFASTLTDASGYYQLKLRSHASTDTLLISKHGYNDTSLLIHAGYDQRLDIALSPIRFIRLNPVTVTPSTQIEGTWFGRLFMSSRQKVRDINLSRFFLDQPFQYSLVPGIGTHGKLSAQVVNKFSLNLLGGYSAGVQGFELGSLFNVDKKNVEYVQIAGLFNTVGGSARGIQLAGLHNGVLDSVDGIQLAGLTNQVRGSLRGVQLGGLANHVAGPVSGWMLAGIMNRADQSVRGLQLGGVVNISGGEMRGMQVSLINKAGRLRGLQLGLINIVDSLNSGYSIGLVNITGFHSVSLLWNESLGINLAYKSGQKALYSILLAGINPAQGQRAYSLGAGLGHETAISSRASLQAEITGQGIYLGSRQDLPWLIRLSPSLTWALTRRWSVFGGPSLVLYLPGKSGARAGYAEIVPAHYFSWFHKLQGWPGIQAGISFR